jgi:PAS domain S-box-containing protein
MPDQNKDKFFLAAIVESSRDSIITIDFEMRITTWNKAAEEVYGYPADEAVGKQLTLLTLPADLSDLLAHVASIRDSGEIATFETQRYNKDGRLMLLEVVMSPVRGRLGTVIGVSTIARDITARRAAEIARNEKETVAHVLVAQEAERSRIARDLHDELGQQVTALRLKLKAAKAMCSDEATCERIDEIEVIAQRMDETVDFVAWELRPALLEGATLPEALDNYVKQWSRHNGVHAAFRSSGLNGTRVPPEAEVGLYRIVQEALHNTAKHAEAASVFLSLELRDGMIVLTITDDGKGFDPAVRGNGSNGMGLSGMRERAKLIGGTWEMETALREGTTIFVRVPVQPEARSLAV